MTSARWRTDGAAIATSDPRATAIGATVLRDGGNCIDAAVAAMLALFVVEPHHCGPGGDAFLLTQLPGMARPQAYDGAGEAPANLSVAALAAAGHSALPPFGGMSVTVPGAPALAWEVVSTLGTRQFGDLVAPAVQLAGGGFDVRPSLEKACAQSERRLAADRVLSSLYLRDGRPVAVGDRIVNPSLAKFLEQLGRSRAGSLYDGVIAAEFAETVQRAGGVLSVDDLRRHRTVEVEPISTTFAGATVWQLPAPTQGPAVIDALDRLSRGQADDWASVADAVRLGLLAVGVDLDAAPWLRRQGGTSHIAVVDADGGMASLITSVFAPFGSGIGVDALGGPLQNRASGFLLVDTAPKAGKPPHTIIPGLVTRDGVAEIALGVAGGLMQPQGQVQLLVRLLVSGESPRSAVDAPRLRVVDGGGLALEAGHPLAAESPEAVGRSPGDGGFGCAQVVQLVGGQVAAAADRRRGGAEEIVTFPDRAAREGEHS